MPVRLSNVDKTGQLMVSAAFDMFQSAAIKHAENLGVGKDAMDKQGLAWILSRMSVYIERRPILDEELTVRSWPRGGQKLFAVRDYDMRDKDDNPVVRGRSGWLILDLEKKRPQRAQPFMAALPQNEGVNAMDDGLEALESAAALTKSGERRAAYSDIDFVGHVNNARYIQWIQDILDPETLYKAARFRLDINYISETLPNETLELWSGPAAKPETIAIEGRRNDGQAAFRAELWAGN